MSWNKLTPTGDTLYVRSPFPGKKIIDPPIQIKAKAKNSKARKIVIEHGSNFYLIKLTSVGQYLRSAASNIFSWEGWLYDSDIEWDGRTEVRMKLLKGG